MSFISQSMKNKFPLWSRVRRENSSNIGIILDAVGEEIEKLRENGYALKLQQKNLLSNPFFQEKKLYKFNLKDDENYLLSMKTKQIESISLLKNDSGTSIPVELNWNRFCFEYPGSFEFRKEENIFELNIFENFLEEKVLLKEKQLYIILENLNNFKDSNSITPGVIIRGENSLGREIEEYIEITNLKTYKTKNYFKKIKPLERTNAFQNRAYIKGGPGVEVFGLDLVEGESEIKISTCAFGITVDEIKSQLTVSDVDPFLESDYNTKANLKNELFLSFKKEEDKSFVEIIHKFLREEKVSLVESSKLNKSFFEEKICNFEISTDVSESYAAEDWTIDVKRNKLVVLGKDKSLRYYPIRKPSVTRATLIEESKDVDLVLECSESYVRLNEEVLINVSLERPKGGINNFFIIKTVEEDGHSSQLFLNETKEWQEEVYLFSGNSFQNKFENIKPSFFFKDTIETYGQANYYVCSLSNATKYETKEELLNKFNSNILNDKKGYYSNKMSLVCALVNPEETIDLSNTLGESDSYDISIEGIENLLFVKDSNSVTKSYVENKETAYFSQDLEAIYFKKKFEESLTLKIDYTDGSFFETELIYANN